MNVLREHLTRDDERKPFDQDLDLAVALLRDLCEHHYPAALSYRHHEKMMPADNYAITISVDPGRFINPEQLREIMEIAERHDAEIHLFDNVLRLMPRPVQPA